MFQEINEGIIFKVKVIPKASRSEIVGWENDELKVRLAAIPDKGKANEELIRLLASVLDIGKSHVRIVQGQTSRHKRVCISGITLIEIHMKLP